MINLHTLKPLDTDIIQKAVQDTGHLVTVEEHSVYGGLGSAVAEVVAECGMRVRFQRVGLQDFVQGYGSHDEVKAVNGLGIDRIMEIVKLISRKNMEV